MSKKQTFLKKILIVVLLGIIVQIFGTLFLGWFLPLFPNLSESYAANINSLLENTPNVIIFVGVIAPILEEIIFRFAILGIANKFLPFFIANIIQALIFGIYHGNIVQGTYAFILGLFIGYLKKKFGSVFYCIMFHMSLNFSGLYIEDISRLLQKYIKFQLPF